TLTTLSVSDCQIKDLSFLSLISLDLGNSNVSIIPSTVRHLFLGHHEIDIRGLNLKSLHLGTHPIKENHLPSCLTELFLNDHYYSKKVINERLTGFGCGSSHFNDDDFKDLHLTQFDVGMNGHLTGKALENSQLTHLRSTNISPHRSFYQPTIKHLSVRAEHFPSDIEKMSLESLFLETSCLHGASLP